MQVKKIETMKLENKAINSRRDEIEKEIKKLQKEDEKLFQWLTKNIEILKKIGEEEWKESKCISTK